MLDVIVVIPDHCLSIYLALLTATFNETHQLNHDRPNLRQPGKGVSHQPPVLLLSKV